LDLDSSNKLLYNVQMLTCISTQYVFVKLRVTGTLSSTQRSPGICQRCSRERIYKRPNMDKLR